MIIFRSSFSTPIVSTNLALGAIKIEHERGEREKKKRATITYPTPPPSINSSLLIIKSPIITSQEGRKR